MPTWLFLAAYTLSGAAGLVYEVTWTRLLTLAMGHGLAASSTVLAAFMGGLAIGAFAAGRVAHGMQPRRALLAYVALESLVVLLAISLPMTLSLATPLFAAAYQDGEGGAWFGLVRVALCSALLLPPAIAIGATFPVAVRYLAHAHPSAAGVAGKLYATNTIGAAVGALLTGFVLLPAFGISTTLWLGVATTLASIVLAIATTGRHAPSSLSDAAPMASPTGPSAEPAGLGDLTTGRRTAGRSGRARLTAPEPQVHPRTLAVLVIVSVTGIVTFSAELAWTRVFALVMGPSTYAFAATVAVFIGGLALGAAAGAIASGRIRHHDAALSVVLALAAVAMAWAVTAAGTWLPRRVLADFAAASSGGLLLRHVWLAALMIVPAAVAIGAVFPLALKVAGGGAAPSRRIGAIYALNTIASVLGALLTGFVMIPSVGLEWTLRLATMLLVMAGGCALWRSSGSHVLRTSAAVLGLAALVAACGGASWDRDLLASGSYKYASEVPSGLDVETALRAGTLVYYKDGPIGTVAVKRLTGALSMSIDGKVDASTAGDMLTQKLLAHLPLLLHAQPRDVAIIGLGSGTTLASALTHAVRTVDALEISPEVAEASRFFTGGLPSPLDDPRTRLIVADGRTHLTLSKRHYDVIVSEPSNPWMAGVASLFTREFFEAASARLSPDGILCQWVNTYDISLRDLQSVVATMASVFPHGTLWLVGEGDLLILGSRKPFDDRFDTLVHAWQRPGVADDLRAAAVFDAFGVLSTFIGGNEAIERFGAGASIQRDDRLALEFSAPNALRSRSRVDNVEHLNALAHESLRPLTIARAWAAADDDAFAGRAAMLQRAGAFEVSYRAALEVVGRSPEHARALAAVVESAVALGRPADALTALRDVTTRHPTAIGPRLALSRVYAASGSADEAARAATDALALDPRQPDALEQLASVFADTGDAGRLEGVVAALARYDDRPGTHYYLAALRFLRHDLDLAEVAARQALARDPRHARAQNLLGAIQATRGRIDDARQALQIALTLDARDPSTYQNLAVLELNAGRPREAARLFAEALSLDPGLSSARDGLARARSGE